MDDSEEIITTDDQTSEQQQNNITSDKQTFDEQATNSNVARTKKYQWRVVIPFVLLFLYCIRLHATGDLVRGFDYLQSLT